ncbi:AAA family ATPase [Persephonella sp. KM09-Lau-8]|uniref:AAA family ATPase n=1 Tax=Persephonella sp. KM09-Lau-8 TaxID=1158345 RepID=UPI00068F51EF|nr:AAA family ATPase [Persephonella sp. KM09-Lau-8]
MMDFLEFFNLKENPFKLTPDVDFFYMSSVHQEALASLEYLLNSEEGFAVIIGEPGTGKTITIRKFLSQIPENVEYAYILFPNLSPEELFMAILEDFGIHLSDKVSKNKLFSTLRDFLIQKRKEGKKVLVIIDEAQNLPVETLEELRILSNLETDKEKLLQIILLGQPELEEKLNSSELRQLRQRISILTRLSNLDYREMVDYINYRLSKAGNSTIRITEKAYKAIYKYTQGNLRLINLLMERALMSAFVENKHQIDKENIESAAESLALRKETGNKKYPVLIGIFALVVFIFAGGFAYFYLNEEKEVSYKKENTEKINNSKTYTISKKNGIVIANILNVRENPSINSKIINKLRKGDKIEIVEEAGDWLKIQKGTLQGWVKKEFVKINNGAAKETNKSDNRKEL